jgi:phosphatidate cytidylyltransferase
MACFLDQAIRYEKPGRTVATIAGTSFAIAYIGLLGSFTIQMRWLDGRGEGLLPLVYLIATAKGADIGAYLIGRLAGRHKLWPQLSPNKTVEGAVGGLLLSVTASLLISRVARFNFELAALEPGSAVLFGLIVGVAAQIGDLMESLIKRDCLRKDASNAVPGFGGVLDVLDSLLFAGPVAYIFWLWVGP